MKKSKIIKLVLVASAFSSCNNSSLRPEKRVYMRSDSTAGYSHMNRHYYGMYYAFRPYGIYNYGGYSRAGYYSSAIPEKSNVGSNSFKTNVVRGGFGSSTFHVSS